MLASMTERLPAEVHDILRLQSGVLSRQQALRLSMHKPALDGLLRSGRWQALQTGVYAAFSGPPSREAVMWAAVLRAGDGAVLSHESAAELYGLTRRPARRTYLTIPAWRRVRPIPGIVVRRSTALDRARHPALLPPRTRVENTVIDLSQTAATIDDAFGWLCRAVGQRLTTAEKIRRTLDAEDRRLRWRGALYAALADISLGILSVLERHYDNGVARAHGLPLPRRQAHLVVAGRSEYVDNLYEEAGVAVELDGEAEHLLNRWIDIDRDNAHAGLGIATLRFGYAHVTVRRCETAGQVASTLRQRGMSVSLRSCGRTCQLPASAPDHQSWQQQGAASAVAG